MNHDTEKEKVKVVSPSRREIELNILPQDVESEFDTILTHYVSKAKLAGFRKGKAPKELVRRMFFSEIQKDVVDSLIPKVLGEELKTTGLHPVNIPAIKDVDFEENQALHARIVFEVMPDFELPSYKKISLSPETESVDDKEIEQALEELQKKSAEYVPADHRGIVIGDYVVVEIQRKDLDSKRLFPLEKVIVLAGHAENDKALDENLQGLKTGEEKTFSVIYKKEDANKKLAGKNVQYRLKVIAIKEKKIPPLNDDLARTLGEHKTLEDLKVEIRTQILASKRRSLRTKQASEILKKIASEVSLELPESIVQDETKVVLSRVLKAYQQTGLGREQADQLASESRKQAEQNIINGLILRKIAEREAITVSDEEVQAELKILAEANQIPLLAVIEKVNKEGKREDIEENILFRKTVDFLIEQAL